ncbi:MAG: right-handed parallel beta-helix repeat-containing protein [Acidimicrobiales bacterium]
MTAVLVVAAAVAPVLVASGAVSSPGGHAGRTGAAGGNGSAGSAAGSTGTNGTSGAAGGSAPDPGPKVCGNSKLLGGPASAPAGAVTVPAGKDHAASLDTPNTTYWFAPGVHRLGGGKFAQIVPGDGDTYVGAPGAVLDGGGVNLYAFTQHAERVTVEYLTIRNFGTKGGNATQGVVNHTSATGWVVTHDTVESNAGAGVMLGSDDSLTDNCLARNGQYGFSAYSTAGVVSNLTVTGNEIAGNATFNWDAVRPGCGCSGGAKFWRTDGAVVTDNYVHDNHKVGLWADTDNTGFDISHNYIARNYAEGIIYEISYNARIADNTLVDNGWRDGANPTLGFPAPAIYVSESGGDVRVPGKYSGTFSITGNDFVDNWGGVVLWENANRFCGDGSDGPCTLVDPSRFDSKSCKAGLPGSKPGGTPDYFDGCRWLTQHVTVDHNTFTFTPKAIGPNCTVQRNCGFTGLFSEYGSSAPYKAWVVPNDISNHQHDVFSDNTYRGPWRFDGFALGTQLTWSQWTHGVSHIAGSGDPFTAQDAGSSYRA